MKTFKYTCHDEFFFGGLKFCPNVKKKYEKRIFDHFFLKKIIRFAKNLNHVAIGFGLVTNF